MISMEQKPILIISCGFNRWHVYSSENGNTHTHTYLLQTVTAEEERYAHHSEHIHLICFWCCCCSEPPSSYHINRMYSFPLRPHSYISLRHTLFFTHKIRHTLAHTHSDIISGDFKLYRRQTNDWMKTKRWMWGRREIQNEAERESESEKKRIWI